MLFRNREYTGGVQGTQVGNPEIFGFEIGSISYPERYGIFVLIMALLTVMVVGNVRRGRSGRRLIAVRTNERAAAALGINVMGAKLFAFSFAAAIAALGGILLAFRVSSISYQSYTSFTSITYVGIALVGGVGYLFGAFVGSTMATAGFTQEILESTWDGVGRWTQLITGISILLILCRTRTALSQNGRMDTSPVVPKGDVLTSSASPKLPKEIRHEARVAPRSLAAVGLTVRYGAVTAVDDVRSNSGPVR